MRPFLPALSCQQKLYPWKFFVEPIDLTSLSINSPYQGGLPRLNPGWHVNSAFSVTMKDKQPHQWIFLRNEGKDFAIWIIKDFRQIAPPDVYNSLLLEAANIAAAIIDSLNSHLDILYHDDHILKSIEAVSDFFYQLFFCSDFIDLLAPSFNCNMNTLPDRDSSVKHLYDRMEEINKESQLASCLSINNSIDIITDYNHVLLPAGDSGYKQLFSVFADHGNLNFSALIDGCLPCNVIAFLEYSADRQRWDFYGSRDQFGIFLATLLASAFIYAQRTKSQSITSSQYPPGAIQACHNLSILLVSNHIGHQIWFEASAMAALECMISDSNINLKSLKLLVPLTHQQYLRYGKLFSRIEHFRIIIVDYSFKWPDCLTYYLRNPDEFVIISRQTKVPVHLAQRVRELYSKSSGSLRNIIVLNIRSGNRVPVNQEEILYTLAEYILEYTSLEVAFTGINYGGSITFSDLRSFDVAETENQIVNNIANRLPSSLTVRITNLVNKELEDEWELLASRTLFCVAPWGAGLAKLNWALRIPSIIYGNEQVLDGSYADWDIYSSTTYVEDPAECHFIPKDGVSNVTEYDQFNQLPNFRQNYILHKSGIEQVLENVKAMIASLVTSKS